MRRDDIIKIVKWTMQYYGSDAGERTNPGSKLQSQAEHIADVIDQFNEASSRLSGLDNITISIFGHDID